jgi:uncharacterized membrane protein YoaK (UPF0700 family)
MSATADARASSLSVAPAILLCLTAVTGVVDAVSFLALHVFTANMTGNVVLLGFALIGTPHLSISRSLLALLCFLVGAGAGGRIPVTQTPLALAAEAVLLFAAAGIALRLAAPYDVAETATYGVIAVTGVAMGIRNAMVRKIGVSDLTTTVLTLTITGLAADSGFAGGDNPRWRRRSAAIAAMLAGAAGGAAIVPRSVALALAIAAAITAACALVIYLSYRKEEQGQWSKS